MLMKRVAAAGRRRTRPEAAQEELHHTKGRDDGHEDEGRVDDGFRDAHRATALYRVVTEAGFVLRARRRGGGRRAGAAAAAMRNEALATVTARGEPLTAGKKGCKARRDAG